MSARLATPVEYAVAVDRYLAAAELRPASRRIYRISLTSWAWPLVGKLPPTGSGRRLANPPIVPLAVLDEDDTAAKLTAAVSSRLCHAKVRTVNRELSVLRSAIGWWQEQRWIGADPTALLRPIADRPQALPLLTSSQRTALFEAPAQLRDKTLWNLLEDCAATVQAVLGINAGRVDVAQRHARLATGSAINFSAETAELLNWLLAGRRVGPVFLTDRRAPAGAPADDVCPLSGRSRMSYRRAAEIFTDVTRPLDPAGNGWMLHQLRLPAPVVPAMRI